MSMIKSSSGFTLIELIMVIVILGILTTVAVPFVGDYLTSTKDNVTRNKLMILKQSLLGDPGARTAGTSTDKGYVGDVGYPPVQLEDLVTKPAADPSWNRYLGTGWNGPYISDDGSGSYLSDAWGNAFDYDAGGRTITSYGPDGASGGGDDIVVSF